MKGIIKKVLPAALIFCMIIGVLAGCTGKEQAGKQAETTKAQEQTSGATTPAQEPSEEVIDTSVAKKIKIILLGDKPEDTDLVYEKVNERLKALINTTVEPVLFDWASADQKYKLVFASGEDFDLIYTSDWMQHSEYAKKDAFYELKEDFLKKYGPKTWADVTPDQWLEVKVDGKIYMVPANDLAFGKRLVMIRGDLRKKYNIPEIKTVDDLIAYWDAIAANEKEIFAYSSGGVDGAFSLHSILFNSPEGSWGGIAGHYYTYINEEPNVVSWNDEKSIYIDVLKQMQEFAKKGYWSRDVLSKKTTNTQDFENGLSATEIRAILNLGQTYAKVMAQNPSWDLEIVDVIPDVRTPRNSVASDGMAIYARSKEPERAMMVLDLLRYDQLLSDLTRLGIEGVHWEAIGEDKYKILPGTDKFPVDGACPWGWRTKTCREDGQLPQVVQDVMKHFEQTYVVVPMHFFQFNIDNVRTEMATVTNLKSTYELILQYGLAEDLDATLNEYFTKLKAAGIDKIVSEWKKQADAFMLNYKNLK